jgi:hypothetical protein
MNHMFVTRTLVLLANIHPITVQINVNHIPECQEKATKVHN